MTVYPHKAIIRSKENRKEDGEEMKTSTKNKCISVLMSVAMCPMMLPTAAFAADDGVASGGGSSSPTELIQSSGQAENADTGANPVDTIAAQSESTGEAANTTTGIAVNKVPAPAAETGGEGATAAVAEVNGTNYASLQAALDAAQDGGTVTLLTDATEDATIAAGKNITLDLGSKTLTNTNAGKATLTIAKDATATVKNGNVMGGKSYYTIQNSGTATLEDVTATAGNTGSSMLDNWGALTIEGGSYTGGLNVVKSEEDSTLTINGGKFELSYATSQGYTGIILNYGNATINSGEFICSASYVKWAHPQCVVTGVVEGHPSSTKITGGTFTNTFKDTSSNIFHGVGKATSDNFEVTGGTFNKSVPSSYFAEGLTYVKNSDGTYGVATAIAQIGTDRYVSLQAAINAVGKKAKTIQLLNDTTENVTIAANKQITLDLNGHTLSGSTGQRKPALTINNASVTVQDSSAAQKGAIMREDTAENSGVSSHYVIDVQGKSGSLLFKSGTVKNNSGAGGTKGASLVRVGDDSVEAQPTMTIAGGTFTQDNFIAIKVDYGTLYVEGGTINSENSYAIENWKNATIKDNAVINGNVSSWTYGGRGSNLTISGGTVNGDVESVTYDGAEGEAAKVAINGGTVNGTLDTIDYRTGATTDDSAKAAIEVTGGTFNESVPSSYCAAGYAPAANADGTYGVKQAVTVTFNSNQGTAVDSQLVTVGDKVVKPADPTKKGYTFSGWFTDEDCTTAYDFDIAVDGTDPEFTLYAGWKAVAPSTVEPGAGDNGSNGDNVASEEKATIVKTGDNHALICGAFALIGVAAAGIAAFALRRKKMN